MSLFPIKKKWSIPLILKKSFLGLERHEWEVQKPDTKVTLLLLHIWVTVSCLYVLEYSMFFLVIRFPSSFYFFVKFYLTSLLLTKRHPVLHCNFVNFGGGAMKGGVCLFWLISNLNRSSTIILRNRYWTFKTIGGWFQAQCKRLTKSCHSHAWLHLYDLKWDPPTLYSRLYKNLHAWFGNGVTWSSTLSAMANVVCLQIFWSGWVCRWFLEITTIW